jgi:hypothetical protein
MRVRTFGIVLALALLAPSAAQAQRTANHQGYWISFGLGGGWSFDDSFFSDTRAGGAAQLRMGGTPSQQLLIGGELIAWTASEENTEVSRGNGHLVVLYYPSPRGGLFLKGGIGAAGRTVETEVMVGGQLATISEDEGGFGLGAGLGYDIQLARNFFLTPAVDFLYQGISDDNSTLLLLTVGATWH